MILEDAGVVVERDDGASVTLFPGEPILSADAVVHDGTLYAAAVRAGAPSNTVTFVYGPWGHELYAVPFEVYDDDPTFEGGIGCVPATGVGCEPGRVLDPTGVAITADDDRVALAVSAETPDGYVPSSPLVSGVPAAQDAIGWAFFLPLP